jgi:ribose 5-phosphate isomerase A
MYIKNQKAKKEVSNKALSYITNNMVLGLGSGSTMEIFINLLGEYVNDNNLAIEIVPSSQRIQELVFASRLKIANKPEQINLTIDGVDWLIEKDKPVIKGYGGALLREKILAYNSQQVLLLADQSKFVEDFENLKIPLEISPFYHQKTQELILQSFTKINVVEWRMQTVDEFYFTDNNHYILDVSFAKTMNWVKLEKELKNIPGVLEVGIFNLKNWNYLTN